MSVEKTGRGFTTKDGHIYENSIHCELHNAKEVFICAMGTKLDKHTKLTTQQITDILELAMSNSGLIIRGLGEVHKLKRECTLSGLESEGIKPLSNNARLDP